MTLFDASTALDDLSNGRVPDSTRVMSGLNALDVLLLRPDCDPALHEAASVLELFVATGGTVNTSAAMQVRYGVLAAAVRRVMADG